MELKKKEFQINDEYKNITEEEKKIAINNIMKNIIKNNIENIDVKLNKK